VYKTGTISVVKNAYEFAIYESGRYSKGAFWKVSDENNTVFFAEGTAPKDGVTVTVWQPMVRIKILKL